MDTGRNPVEGDKRLLQAAAASHRRWFEERCERNRFVDGDLEDVEGLVREARAGCGGFGVWSLGPDDPLGVRLVARGFEWGWKPHWMAVELDAEPEPPAGFEVVPAGPPFATTLPYVDDGPVPPGAVHLGVRLREKLIGQVIVVPEDGVAGVYSMGVVPKVQGRGIGMALVRAGLRAAWRHGCRAAVLNATPDGERLYSRAGFRSLGWGQTWWSKSGPAPTGRQTAIAEAVGLGDLAALEDLGPGEAEIAAALPLAVMVGQVSMVDNLLGRFPGLTAERFPDDDGNLLHLAVAHDRPEIAEVALRHGVDKDARDPTYGATPAGWAEHLGHPEIGRLVT